MNDQESCEADIEERDDEVLKGNVLEEEDVFGDAMEEGLVKQRVRRLQKRGEQLHLMLVGEPGIGKRSSLGSLFGLVESEHEGEVGRVTVKVQVVDLRDAPAAEGARLLEGLEKEFERALEREKKVDRLDYEGLDEELGVDAVLYFVAPHRFTQADIEIMTLLHKRVALIPILSKADAMTTEELRSLREEVIESLKAACVTTFRPPFAIVNSKVQRTPSGKLLFSRGREYPWGTAISEDSNHSELPALRKCLLYEELLELHARRRENFELYRTEKLKRSSGSRGGLRALLKSIKSRVVVIAAHTIVGIGFLMLVNKTAAQLVVSVKQDADRLRRFIFYCKQKEPNLDDKHRKSLKSLVAMRRAEQGDVPETNGVLSALRRFFSRFRSKSTSQQEVKTEINQRP